MFSLTEQNGYKEAYANFAICYTSLVNYSVNPTEETQQELLDVASMVEGGMPLPSGRYGNILAVALEMGLYPAALFLINNSNTLGINLSLIATAKDGRNELSAYETFLLANNIDEVTVNNIANAKSQEAALQLADKLESIFDFRSQR